jgi:hypothetical protein
MTNPPEKHRPVTLEDLLRLKRAERPAPEFWTRFDSELRAKQLAAIVDRRPWWKNFSVGTALWRHRLSLGAATLALLTFVSVQGYRSSPPSSEPVLASAEISPASTGAAPASGAVSAADEATAASGSFSAAADVMPTTIAAAEATNTSNPVETNLQLASAETSSRTSAVIPWIMSAERVDPNNLSPTERFIATNWEAAKAAHPELVERFSGVSGFEKRNVAASRQTVDPLAQMRPPSELHLRRLLASARPAVSTNVTPASDRLARRISEERLTEEAISRFGARGNEVSLKF